MVSVLSAGSVVSVVLLSAAPELLPEPELPALLLVPDPDDRALLEALIPAMYEELPEPKPRRKKAAL